MICDGLYLDLLAYASTGRPQGRLEDRMIAFLESDPFTESLDGSAFAKVIGSQSKADYLLGARGIVAELKTVNGSPLKRTEERLKARLSKPDAPILFGTLGVSRIIEPLADRDAVAKVMADMAGRAVRRHLLKANEQIGAIKERLGLPDAGGVVILMNDSEAMIDAAAVGYTLLNAFGSAQENYPHITGVWAVIESHRIAMQGGRLGYPQLYLFRALDRQGELGFMARMFEAWGRRHGSRIERIPHLGDWDAMRPIYDGPAPTLVPFG